MTQIIYLGRRIGKNATLVAFITPAAYEKARNRKSFETAMANARGLDIAVKTLQRQYKACGHAQRLSFLIWLTQEIQK